MLLPPLPVQSLDMLCALQLSMVLFDGLLEHLATSRGSWARWRCMLKQSELTPRYLWLLGGVWALWYVIIVIFGVIFKSFLILRVILFGLLLLLTISPWWGLRGLSRYYACAQGVAVTLWVCLWPARTCKQDFLWVWLVSIVSYTILFVVTTLWCRYRAS